MPSVFKSVLFIPLLHICLSVPVVDHENTTTLAGESVTQLHRTESSTQSGTYHVSSSVTTVQMTPTLIHETSTELQTIKPGTDKKSVEPTTYRSPVYEFKTTREGRKRVFFAAAFCFIILLIIAYTVGS